jgi:hypothetical protein
MLFGSSYKIHYFPPSKEVLFDIAATVTTTTTTTTTTRPKVTPPT